MQAKNRNLLYRSQKYSFIMYIRAQTLRSIIELTLNIHETYTY